MRKKETLSFLTALMDFESIVLCDKSQTEKDKYCMVSLICGLFTKKSKSQKQRIKKWLPGAREIRRG